MKNRDFVVAFINCIDGVDIYPPEVAGIGSFALGLCKVEYSEKDQSLSVYLRRPGLLIGRKGETLEKVKAYIGCNIKIHEIDLFRNKL